MTTEIVIKLNGSLRDAALEVQALNAAQIARLNGAPYDPIPCNPDSETEEGFLGIVNTPPTAEGLVTVVINREWLCLADLPAMPKTFSFVLGEPPAGRII